MKGGEEELKIPFIQYTGENPKNSEPVIDLTITERQLVGILKKYPDVTAKEILKALGNRLNYHLYERLDRLTMIGVVEVSGEKSNNNNGVKARTYKLTDDALCRLKMEKPEPPE